MANWAQNWLTFEGTPAKINKVHTAFKKMHKDELKTNEGQLPSFMNNPEQDFFFNICLDDFPTIYYETKWSPNVIDVVTIANHFKLNFEVSYEEKGSDVYGKAKFKFGDTEATHYDLDEEDFNLYSYDEEDDIYTYESEDYECEDDILEHIFEKKFNLTF